MVLGDASQQLWTFLSHPRTFSSSAWAFGFDMKRAGLVKSFGPTTSIYYHMVEFNYGQERVSFILDFPMQTNESLIENDTPSKILFARFAQYIKFL